MATPTQQPPIPPEERLALEQQARYQRITRNLAIGGVVLCPIIAILPPRKLDLYTFSLGVGFYLSADHLVTLRTGRGLVQNLSPMRAVELPTERARETQRILAEEREKGRKALEKQGEEKEREMGVLAKLWMGDEKEGWKERRLEEEKKALEEGKSYTDMIFEQIWDVWNWDKKKGGKGDDGSKRE
ncbi:Nn.00g002270.m01.CDS01 [Neocucurbitaria sp. VM-36]